MALACLAFAGCGAADNNATAPAGEAEPEVENALEDAGMGDISAEDYNQGGPTSDQ